MTTKPRLNVGENDRIVLNFIGTSLIPCPRGRADSRRASNLGRLEVEADGHPRGQTFRCRCVGLRERAQFADLDERRTVPQASQLVSHHDRPTSTLKIDAFQSMSAAPVYDCACLWPAAVTPSLQQFVQQAGGCSGVWCSGGALGRGGRGARDGSVSTGNGNHR